HPVDADADRIAPCEEVAQGVADRGRPEVEAEPSGRKVEHLAADEGRAAEIGEERPRGERGGKAIAPEPARGEKLGVLPDLVGETRPMAGRRLAEVGPDHPEDR